jgi:hypothetical protein
MEYPPVSVSFFLHHSTPTPISNPNPRPTAAVDARQLVATSRYQLDWQVSATTRLPKCKMHGACQCLHLKDLLYMADRLP